MSVEFKKFLGVSKFLDPRKDFVEKTFLIEFRTDPLTKDMGQVLEFRRKQVEKPDLSGLIAKSLEGGCPFCPDNIDKDTPKFIPDLCSEGRIKFGEATVFPNAAPYMPYSALTVISSKHFIALPDFTRQILSDAFIASQTYLRKVNEYDPEAKYHSIMWNYMPPANSTQLHPHLQAFAGYFPLVYHQTLLGASMQYYNENGAVFWSDFIAEEKKLQERCIGTIGNTVWLTSFVPRSLQLDVQAIFQDRKSILSLSHQDIEDFTEGLTRVLKYMDEQSFYSLNMCLFSGITGEDSFWTQARVIQRGTLPPLDVSDVGNAMLLGDTRLSTRRPETTCQELRSYFD